MWKRSYLAMDDHVLDLIIGDGPSARSICIDLAPSPWWRRPPARGLRPTLRDRFGIPLRLEFYTPKELQQVLTQAARKMGAELTPDGAAEIAGRARARRGSPAGFYAARRDFAGAEGAERIDRACATRGSSARLEVDEAGLDSLDRRYLRVLIENYGGGPAGVETLAYAIAEARDAVEDVIEPFLMQQGFIQRTPRGRLAAAKAYLHIGLIAAASAQGAAGVVRGGGVMASVRPSTRRFASAQDDEGYCHPLDLGHPEPGVADDRVEGRRRPPRASLMTAPTAGAFEGREHQLPVRVYYEDTDFTGVVYHGAYVRYFERGRSDFLRLAGVSHTDSDVGDDPTAFVVTRMIIDFSEPGADRRRASWSAPPTTPSRARLFISQRITRDEALIAQAEVEAVCITLAGRARKPPPGLVERLKPWFSLPTP